MRAENPANSRVERGLLALMAVCDDNRRSARCGRAKTAMPYVEMLTRLSRFAVASHAATTLGQTAGKLLALFGRHLLQSLDVGYAP